MTRQKKGGKEDRPPHHTLRTLACPALLKRRGAYLPRRPCGGRTGSWSAYLSAGWWPGPVACAERGRMLHLASGYSLGGVAGVRDGAPAKDPLVDLFKLGALQVPEAHTNNVACAIRGSWIPAYLRACRFCSGLCALDPCLLLARANAGPILAGSVSSAQPGAHRRSHSNTRTR